MAPLDCWKIYWVRCRPVLCSGHFLTQSTRESFLSVCRKIRGTRDNVRGLVKVSQVGRKGCATRIAGWNTVKRIESVDGLSAVRTTADESIWTVRNENFTCTIGNSYFWSTISRKIENRFRIFLHG